MRRLRLPAFFFVVGMVLMRPAPVAADTVFSVGGDTVTPAAAQEPLEFPFGLQGGESKNDVTNALQKLSIDRDTYDNSFTVWNIAGRIASQSFRPPVLSLSFRGDKLAQVTLVQPEMTECQEVATMVEDAAAYVQSHYHLDPSSVQKAPHYGTTNCFFYMKTGNVGWAAAQGDYVVGVDTNSHNLKYTGYLTFTYLPLFNQAQQ